jgi:hypothetical protein
MPCGFDKYFRTLSGVGPACTVRVRTPEHFVLHYEHFVFTFRTVLYSLPYHMRPDAPTRAGPVGCTLHCSRGPGHASLLGPGPHRSPGPGVRTKFI